MKCKKLVTFNDKSLFTNVPISEAIEAARRTIERLDEDQLSLPRDGYVPLVRLCLEFGPLEFRANEYERI